MKKVSRKDYEILFERLESLERFYLSDSVHFYQTTKYSCWKNQPPYVQVGWSSCGPQTVENAEKFIEALQAGIALAKRINEEFFVDCIFED